MLLYKVPTIAEKYKVIFRKQACELGIYDGVVYTITTQCISK